MPVDSDVMSKEGGVVMNTQPTVLLADDHVLVAQGIQKLLEPEFELLRIVPDGRALLKAIEECQPDVAIVDISLPLLNGLDASRHILKHHPNVKVIVLTMHSEQSFVAEALRIGVSGYVLKQSVGSELVEALKVVLNGDTFVSPILVDQTTRSDPDGEAEEAPKGFAHALSLRQREVLQLVAEGKSIKEVAAVLNVSIKTVEFHKTRIMRQLGMRSAAQLTKYAIANGLITIH
jgi:DNA-binding NarL/FixJ family response regulator